jgi:hypothetical protein
MADARKVDRPSSSADEVKVVASVPLNGPSINAAASSPQGQTVLVMQEDRTRNRGVDQGDD